MNGTPRLHPPPPRECGLEHCDASGSRRAPRTARRRGSPPVPSCCALPALSHPLAVVCNARSHLAAAARPPAPPRPFGYARLPCGGPLLSFLRSSLFSAPCTPAPCFRPRPLLSPSPRAPVSKQLQVEAPDAGGAFAVVLDGLFSGVSICFSLSTHTARAASCHFSASARSAAHTIRYNCMMSPGIPLLQRAASSGIILRQSESITCQLHPTT